MMWPDVNCDETTPCLLPPTSLFQNSWMFFRLVMPICVLSTESLHIVLKSLLACVCLGLLGDVCGGCRPWIQLCLSEKYLAVTEGKADPQEGQQGPRDPANRKLTLTLVHLPNVHSLEISVSLMFFHGNVSFYLTSFFWTFSKGKVMLSMHSFFSLLPILFNISQLLLDSLSDKMGLKHISQCIFSCRSCSRWVECTVWKHKSNLLCLSRLQKPTLLWWPVV